MLTTYTSYRLHQFIASLSSRLGDPTNQFWTRDELALYAQDSLRTYNALTGFWRQRGTFASVDEQVFYDIPSVLPDLRAQTVTDRDEVTLIEYGLIEPPIADAWTGSDQFTLAAVTQALQRRRDAFLLETGVVITTRVIPIAPARSTRTVMPQSVIDVRHAYWQGTDGSLTPLVRSDEYAFNAFKPAWNLDSSSPPSCYSVGVVPPLQIQLAPAPLDTGMIQLVSVETGPALDPSTGVVLGVPDDWAWVVRFGAMADLLAQAGIGQDLPRAQYCQQRWVDGVSIAKATTATMTAQVDEIDVPVMALADADQFNPSWATDRGTPSVALVAGVTCLAFSPVLWTPLAPVGLTVDVVRNAPTSTELNSFVQAADENMDAILDYAQHLASFKLGGSDFLNTSMLLDRFYASCGVDAAHRIASVPDRDFLTDRTVRDEQENPRSVGV